MQDLRISLIQTFQIWEDKQANLAHLEKKISQVGTTDLILLPEMFNTGFSMNKDVLAEESSNSESINWLKRNARQANAAIYTSLIIREGESYYNRACFVEPEGGSHFYDKRKLFSLAGEDEHFKAGEKAVIAN